MSDQNILFKNIVNVCQKISDLLRSNTDFNIFESTSTNKSGDAVKLIDELCNNIFLDEFKNSDLVGGIASEELDEPIIFDSKKPYILIIDPLDGSSNPKSNAPSGSIFSFYKVSGEIKPESFLKSGKNVLFTGYCLYGASTQLLVANHKKINLYLLNNTVSLIKENIKFKDNKKYFSMNPNNFNNWSDYERNIYNKININSSFRYVGCLVADFHRILIEGGFFAYPADNKNEKGKLRLLYECIPMAHIMKVAGGFESNGFRSILEIQPESFHEKSPLFLGADI